MRVFISYRRSDTQDFSGRLADRLREAPGVRQVFIDVDGIEPGETFPQKLDAALKDSDAILIVIGDRWAGPRGPGERPRVFDEGDFVRLEARRALASGQRAIPVLANGASMPSPLDLPDDLQLLTQRNAVSIRHSDFDRDVDYLIDLVLKQKKPSAFSAYLNRHPAQAGALRGALGFFAGGAALLVFGMIMFEASGGRSLNLLFGDGPTALLIAGWLAASVAAPILLMGRRRRAARA